jgi:hypothetical protein
MLLMFLEILELTFMISFTYLDLTFLIWVFFNFRFDIFKVSFFLLIFKKPNLRA